ncbi:MAG TPA: ABC transporter ATP-binding protein [Spirochaetia bacterium]|nr:ABC transporter ATP-binding protein [Spirochaetales bacterium]HRY79469.1 ABC transporter ATP-binding protein [Spirochaetia bacterium]HRZ87965.1 ABC transporter ATP-binding protein [Spirochaetia bacterium]
MAILQLSDVHKTYPLGKTEVHAVRGVSLEIQKGDFVSIAGPSGSGKSTILNLIGCIDRPSGGSVRLGGVDTAKLSDRELTRLRHRVLGFIFQSFNLIPVLDVYENVEFPLLLGREVPKPAERRERVGRLIREVGLETWTRHKANELSGGQRQRVAIARALVTRPEVVLADEPTANLDSATGESILALMQAMNREFGTTFVFSTHDARIVDLADHVVRLKDGRIAEEFRRGGAA